MNWQVTERFEFNQQGIAWGRMGEGPPLVLLHGTPFSSYEWNRIAPVLARTHTVYFHDMPGYGCSDMHDGQDVSLGVQNEVLAALFAYWKIEKPHIVAHDFGGATALRAHLINGCEYASLTLIDPVAIRPWGSPLVQHVRSHEDAFAGMPGFMHEAILPAYLQSALHRHTTLEQLEPYIAAWRGRTGQRAFYRQIAQMDQLFTDEVQDRYSELRCPVQLMWGEEDQWIPIAQGRLLAGMLPACPFHAIANAGHLVQEDSPEAIISLVQKFLATVS